MSASKIPLNKPALALLGAAALAFTGCYYMPDASGDKAHAGLALNKSIAPNTTSIALVVEGPGMQTITAEIPMGQSDVSNDVPTGLARKFTLIDEGGTGVLDRFVSFDNMSGDGWTTFGNNGMGMNQFQFFSDC